MTRIKSVNGYTIFQAGPRDVSKYGFTAGSFYVYFSSDVRDFGLLNSTPEFEDCGSIEEAVSHCTGNFALAKEIVEGRTTAASMEEILEVETQLDAGMDAEEIDAAEELKQELADVVAERLPGMVLETVDKVATIAAGFHITPEVMERIISAFEGIAEEAKKIAARLLEAFRPIAEWAIKICREAWESLARAYAPPKWWHYYKHAKKRRTRKKYEHRIRDSMMAAIQAAQRKEAPTSESRAYILHHHRGDRAPA